jgi:hypothetical protein
MAVVTGVPVTSATPVPFPFFFYPVRVRITQRQPGSDTIVRLVGLLPLCLTRRSVVRLIDLAELHRNGSVDADAALDAISRTPVLVVVVRQWDVREPA